MTKVIICDIDGTIANSSHRMHHILKHPKDWKSFFDDSLNDPVNEDVKWILGIFNSLDYKILFVTARPESERELTETWLHHKAEMHGLYHKLYMRDIGDHRDDSIVKQDILIQIRQEGLDPYLALDDRDHVIAMWRDNGVHAWQVRAENGVGKMWEKIKSGEI